MKPVYFDVARAILFAVLLGVFLSLVLTGCGKPVTCEKCIALCKPFSVSECRPSDDWPIGLRCECDVKRTMPAEKTP